MTDFNTLGASIATTKSINGLISHINNTCDQLMKAVNFTADGVSSYGTKITDVVMNSQFVDRVINNTQLLKHHLHDLKKKLPEMELQQDEINTIIPELRKINEKFETMMSESYYFSETFGWLVKEIMKDVEKTINKLPVKG